MDTKFIIAALLLGFVATPLLGLLLKWVDRFLTARIQWRKGPPVYQPLADVLKLLGKETIVSEKASAGMFLLGPVIGFVGVAAAATILWGVVLKPEVSFTGDLVLVFYLLTLPALGLILGASASGSPHAGLGAGRETKLLIAYELPFILALVPPILKAGGTLRFLHIAGGVPLLPGPRPEPILMGISMFLAALCALAVVQAKLAVIPFDMSEAEGEIMGGAIVEYSGPPLAMIYLVRASLLFLLPMFVITVFWGGLTLQGWGILTTILKFVGLLVVIVLAKNTQPRLTIEQAMKFFWFMVTPVAVIACVLALYAVWVGGAAITI